MIYYAEAFTDMSEAKARWRVLEERQRHCQKAEAIIVSSWLDDVPHVLAMGTGLPEGFFRDPKGRVHFDIDPSVWLRLWARHEERRRMNGSYREVIQRPMNTGIKI